MTPDPDHILWSGRRVAQRYDELAIGVLSYSSFYVWVQRRNDTSLTVAAAASASAATAVTAAAAADTGRRRFNSRFHFKASHMSRAKCWVIIG